MSVSITANFCFIGRVEQEKVYLECDVLYLCIILIDSDTQINSSSLVATYLLLIQYLVTTYIVLKW